MTEQNPPLFLEAAEHPSDSFRRLIEVILQGGYGVIQANGFTASPGAGLTIDVAAGDAFIPGTLNESQGVYFVENRGPENVEVTAGNATLPRKDRLVAEVLDAFYAGAENVWRLRVVPGVPASPPLAPAIPDNAIGLYAIDVPAGASSSSALNIVDERPFAVLSSTAFANESQRSIRLPSPRPGQQTYLTAPLGGGPSRWEFWDATASQWRRLGAVIVTGTGDAPIAGEPGTFYFKVSG